MDLIGKLIPDGHRRYRILSIVGTWGDHNEYGVYRCRRTPQRLEYPSVAIKVLPRTLQNQDFWQRTENQITQYEDCFNKGYTPKNLLLYEKSFVARLLNVRSCFTILPLNIRSIRSLLINNHSNGMPMNLVAFLVRECVNGLVDLHDFRISHGELSAGALFYNPADRSGIKLAQGPTYYVSDLNVVPEPGFRPMSELATWGGDFNVMLGNGGLPPANVHDEDDADEEDLELSFRMKQDIWAVGVLALEIGYGRIAVTTREEFLKVIEYIVNHTGLPNTWNQLRWKTTTQWRMRTVLSNPRFTYDYIDFLQCCFNLTMADRPSAAALLNHNFLTRDVCSMEEFHNSVAPNMGL